MEVVVVNRLHGDQCVARRRRVKILSRPMGEGYASGLSRDYSLCV
jgi:hypothetical protein